MAKTLYVDNSDLTRDKRFSFLTEDIVSGGSTFRIQSIVGFESLDTSSGQILCIGEVGNERTEIQKTSSSTGPSASYKEITLNETLKFDHPQDTKVYVVDWNRVDFQHAATITGAKSTLRSYPLDIQPDQLQTQFVETSQSSGYYFSRFNETVGNTSSDWSDPIPYGGFDDNTVYAIEQAAVDALDEEIDGKIITKELLHSWLWQARREYHDAPGKRPFRRKFNTVIGSALTGSFRIELPTDVERPYTAENIYGVRIGTNRNMNYVDKKVWDLSWENKPRSTLDVPYTVGVSTSIWLTNGRDFDSGSANIQVEGTTIGVSRITGENGSFNIDTHGDWSASAGSDAYENVTLGLPNEFTVFADPGGSAYIFFDQPIDTAYINQNIYVDYYRTLVGYDSDADVLDEPEYDMYKHYLMARIKHRRSQGEMDMTRDPDFQLWLAKKEVALGREVLSTDVTLSPDVSHLPMPE